MSVREVVSPDLIVLDLQGETGDEILQEMVALLALDGESASRVLRYLTRLQDLSSTRIGHGIALVYARLPVFDRVRVGFGRSHAGVDFKAWDGAPVHHFFLIVGPPIETDEANWFLPVLGRLAQFAKDPEIPASLSALETPGAFLELLESKGL